MDRRTFLALIASAPIAALAPWPKILEQQRHTVTPNIRAVDGAVVIGQRVWKQGCACNGSGMHYGPIIMGAGVALTIGQPRKPPYCTSCGTDWRAEYV